MSEKEEPHAEEEQKKELTVEDLEDVAGGFDQVPGVEIGETSGGTKDIRAD